MAVKNLVLVPSSRTLVPGKWSAVPSWTGESPEEGFSIQLKHLWIEGRRKGTGRGMAVF
jgi:hypothetical protein